MTRGPVWWVKLEGDAGFRPVVVVSRTEGSPQRNKLIVAETTRTVRSLPSEIVLGTSDGMNSDCVINTDNLHTIARGDFRLKITELSPEHMFQLDAALEYSLGLDW